MGSGSFVPCSGDKVLLVSADDMIREGISLSPAVPFAGRDRPKASLVTASTVEEAIQGLGESIDLIWLHLPLPGLHNRLLIESIQKNADLACDIGGEGPESFIIEGPYFDLPDWQSIHHVDSEGFRRIAPTPPPTPESRLAGIHRVSRLLLEQLMSGQEEASRREAEVQKWRWVGIQISTESQREWIREVLALCRRRTKPA
jgi:hypothetical protein